MRYLWRDGDWVEASKAAPRNPVHGRGPMLIRDQMAPIRSMADGRMFDSKRGYYRSLKEQGREIVGDDYAWTQQQPTYEPQDVGRDIKRAIEELEGQP